MFVHVVTEPYTEGREANASKFPICWWGAFSTLSDRHQLDELSGLHSEQNEILDVAEPGYANARGCTDLIRLVSFPTGRKAILMKFERGDLCS